MNLKISSLLFLLTLSFFSFSQETNRDSLHQLSYEELSNSFYKKYYDADIYDSIGNLYATAYISKAKEKKDTIRIADCYRYKSILSDNETALEYCDSIIRMTKNNESFNYPALGYMMKGYFLWNNNGKDKESLDYYLKAYKYALRQKNIVHQVQIKGLIADYKMSYNQYNEAISLYKEIGEIIISLPENKKHKYPVFWIYRDFSRVYLRAKKPDSASYYNQKGLVLSLEQNNLKYYKDFLSNSAYIDYFKGNYQEALDSINKAESFNIIDQPAINYYYKGKIAQKRNNLEKTVFYFNKIDSIYQLDNNPYLEWPDVYKTLANYHASKSNYKEQLNNIYKLIAVDSVLHSNSIYIDKQIKDQYEIPQLKHQSEELEKLILKNKTKNKFIITFLSIIILLSILFILFQYLKQRKYKRRFDEFISNQNTQSQSIKEVLSSDKPIEKLSIPDKVIQKILKNIEAFENEKTFLDNNISLSNVAKEFSTNSSYLSKIINHYKNSSFSNYISGLRLDYCIKKLKENKKFRNYTIEAIADEIGFNTAESFSKAFYKKTGVYPSFFIKQLNKKVS